jgi:hypothetical protein
VLEEDCNVTLVLDDEDPWGRRGCDHATTVLTCGYRHMSRGLIVGNGCLLSSPPCNRAAAFDAGAPLHVLCARVQVPDSVRRRIRHGEDDRVGGVMR